jgi:NADH-quinone oxidoreductase subunit I
MFIWSALRTSWLTFLHLFHKTETVRYPEQKPKLSPRYRGRIVLTRDPDGAERCVSCHLCAAVCPCDCIDLVYEKENLLIAGIGKVPDYNFYRVAGIRGQNANAAPVDPRGLLP